MNDKNCTAKSVKIYTQIVSSAGECKHPLIKVSFLGNSKFIYKQW